MNGHQHETFKINLTTFRTMQNWSLRRQSRLLQEDRARILKVQLYIIKLACISVNRYPSYFNVLPTDKTQL